MTTIQKLNNAISNDRYENEMAFLKDQKVIFILMNVIVVSLVKRIKN